MLKKYENFFQKFEALQADVAMLKGQSDSDWYTIKELCAKYKLTKNNIKSRKWRLQNDFPTYQDGPYCRMLFRGKEVEQWMKDKLSSKKCS